MDEGILWNGDDARPALLDAARSMVDVAKRLTDTGRVRTKITIFAPDPFE